jgi:hypothetical protein
MAKKADRPVVSVGGTGSYPNPRYFGLKGKYWNQIQKYVDELYDIKDREEQANARRMELAQELEYQQAQLEQAKVDAARRGEDEPDGSALKLTEQAMAKQVERGNTLRKAAQQVQRDLQEFLQAGPPPEVLEELREMGRKHEENYRRLIAEAMKEREALGRAYGLHMFARGVEERGYATQHNRFSPVPLSPAPDGSAWHEHPLRWGDDEEYSDVPITYVHSGQTLDTRFSG